MNTRAKIYLAGLMAGSALSAAYDGIVYVRELESSALVTVLWPTVFFGLLILWVIEDSKVQPAAYRPFDYGFLVSMFWIPYLPYYLWKTRRGMGLLMLLGFATLYLLGTLLQWTVYAMS